MDFLIRPLRGIDPSNDALLLSLLLFDDFLALLQEQFKVFDDVHHADVERVDTCLHCLLVRRGCPSLHLLRRQLYFLLVHLDLCQRVFDLDVEL